MKVFNSLIILICIFIPIFLSCALHNSKSGKDSTQNNIEKLNTDIERFYTTVQDMKVSEYDSTCPYPFQDDFLQSYVINAYDKNYKNAQLDLFKIYKQLDCVSAKRFMEIYSAFYKEVLSKNSSKGKNSQSRITQVLTPLAFVFIDIGGSSFRPIYMDWIKQNIKVIKKSQKNPESTLNQIGIYTSIDPSLIALYGNQIVMLTNSADALESGNCRIIDLALIPNEDENTEQKLFCPKDCETDLATSIVEDEENEAGAAGLLESPEVKEACKQMKEAIDNLSKPSIDKCFKDFAENDNDFLACQVNNFKADRADVFGRLRPNQPERDIHIVRNCHQSQQRGEQISAEGLLEVWQDIRSHLRDDQDILRGQRNSAQGALNVLGNMFVDARDGDPDEPYDGPGSGPGLPPITGTNEEVKEKSGELLTIVGQDARDLDKLLSAIQDAIDEFTNKIDKLRDEINNSKGRCSPESDTCSDSCNTFDQIAQDTKKCLKKATAPDDPVGPIDPNIAEPVPTDPDELPESIEALSGCIMNALSPGNSVPITQNDCAAWTMCRNGEMPRGMDCKCLLEQNVAEGPVRNCGLWARCTDSQEGPCCQFTIGQDEADALRNRGSIGPLEPIDPESPQLRILSNF